MTHLRAEVISIGDEITSGVRLDTNSQWLSARLGELGIQVAFHTTVGDDLADNVHVFRQASKRVDLVISTGGLGPTADDLTRQAIAQMANVKLQIDQGVLDHIKSMYKNRGREMPHNNEVQAWFPEGSRIIANPEGTAPGIDFSGCLDGSSTYRIFALPGVPVEMKQMWNQTVEPELRQQVGDSFVIHHHTIHCFGSGESHIESLLPGLVARGRDPQVGITASSATISLRISTKSSTIESCLEKMQPTITIIREQLGELIFGENGIELQHVVVDLLSKRRETLAIVDAGLHGEVANLISSTDQGRAVLVNAQRISTGDATPEALALSAASSPAADWGLAIGSIERNDLTVDAGNSFYEVAIAYRGEVTLKQFRYSGHSGWRESRAVKEVINFLRLSLQR